MSKEEVTDGDIARCVALDRRPVAKLVLGEGQAVQLEAELHTRVIGQETAVTSVAEAVQRSRATCPTPTAGGVHVPRPTGVGKTELAKALAELPVQLGHRADPPGHVRVHGEALRAR